MLSACPQPNPHYVPRLYYQNNPARLSTCPITIHALLHIADSIISSGPVWASWAFPMERYCGILKPAIRSRRHPFVALDNYIADVARLAQAKAIFNATEVLALRPPPNDHSVRVPGCTSRSVLTEIYTTYSVHVDDTCVLLPPERPSQTLMDTHRDRLISSLATRYNVSGSVVRTLLPESITRWGKVQILDGGDLICSSSLGSTQDDTRKDRRNASWVRVCHLYYTVSIVTNLWLTYTFSV